MKVKYKATYLDVKSLLRGCGFPRLASQLEQLQWNRDHGPLVMRPPRQFPRRSKVRSWRGKLRWKSLENARKWDEFEAYVRTWQPESKGAGNG